MNISNRTKIIVVVLLLLLAGWNLYANRKDPADLNVVDRTVLFVTSPIQLAITWSIDRVVGAVNGYVALVGVEAENEELRDQQAEMEIVEARVRELELENQRLRRLSGLREDLAPATTGAKVVGWGTSNRYRVIRIDRGRADGVAPGQAVIGSAGVVGQVLHTSAGAADVLLMSDMSSGIAARMQETRLRGIVVGDGRWAAQLDYVARQEARTVQAGDLLVTTGDDGVFPGGIPVGRVKTVELEETGQFLTLDVDPAEDLTRIEDVLVFLEDPDEEGTDVGPAFGVQALEEGPRLSSGEDPAADEASEPGDQP